MCRENCWPGMTPMPATCHGASKRGKKPDPYHVWLSEIMLQQTTVAAVRDYYIKFLSLWPTVSDLAKASQEDVLRAWAGLGYYARARNLHACAIKVVSDWNGKFPDTEEALRTLPGIGPYTAAAIAAIAFDRPHAAVDGNVERVMSRVYAIETPLARGKAPDQGKGAGAGAGETRRGFRPGPDGSWRHDLHAAHRQLRNMSVD